jgi:TPR repeat protein
MYAKGQGVVQDYKQAVKWYRKAAEQGDNYSSLVLGGMYESGEGVPMSIVIGHMYYNLAAASFGIGSISGKEGRDRLTKKMTPSQIAEAHKLAREWMRNH